MSFNCADCGEYSDGQPIKAYAYRHRKYTYRKCRQCDVITEQEECPQCKRSLSYVVKRSEGREIETERDLCGRCGNQ